jgi:hypothetical protein
MSIISGIGRKPPVFGSSVSDTQTFSATSTYSTAGIVNLTFVNQTTSTIICPVLPNRNYSMSVLFNWTSASITVNYGFNTDSALQVILCNSVSGGNPVAPYLSKVFILQPYTPTADGIPINTDYTVTNVFNSGNNSLLQFAEFEGNCVNTGASVTLTATVFLQLL